MYELKSYKKPLIKGHHPIPLEESEPQSTIAKATKEAIRLFSNVDCWHITINEFAIDAGGKELHGTPHWCADVDQVETWLAEN